MSELHLITIVVVCGACFVQAYRWYGRRLAKWFRLDPSAPTPAVTLRDDVDFVPIESRFLLSQHFSAIAAAGPIVGPILAGVMFGWLPALLWIVLGSIFVGGVHDLAALTASIRHRARSIAEVVREHMTRRAYVLFMLFVWFALSYIITAFTDITAASFVGLVELESGQRVSGAGIATSSLLYLALPVVMGLLLRYTRLSLHLATLVFVPLIGVAIWAGQLIPLDLAALPLVNRLGAQRCWDVLLLAYCFVASLVPMWMLLQPRGHLGGYFLYIALVGGAAGLVLCGERVQYPAFLGWRTPRGETLFPMLFILIACGACSGFHAIVASGTTSKQLRTESDARLIGYGAMVMEGMVAVISLCCVMRLAPDSPLLAGGPKPNFLYAEGVGSFLAVLSIPKAFAVSFALMAFTTFVYDTLDVCTRLGRYIVEELAGWHGRGGRVAATAVTAGVPLLFLLQGATDAAGNPVPAWRLFWDLFGASNQLLASLTLIGVTVWLWRTYRARWVWFVTGLPTVWMYVMSLWALVRIMLTHFRARGLSANPVPWVALLLVALAVLIAVEALRVFTSGRQSPPSPRGLAPAAA